MVTPEESADLMAPFGEPTAAYRVAVATDDDLAWVVERFVDAARRVLAAGFDGVELHAGHGYLLHSFLSPSSNQRDDRWGGSPERRAELLVEVVRAVRGAVGPAVPLWARIGAFEAHRSPGQTLEDALVAMGLAVAAGIDAVHVTAYGEPMVATGITDGHTPHEPGALLPAAARVRRELGVPVIAMGRLTPEAAEQALADGAADVIAMGRALIADPDLPAKLAAGARHRIRPCAYQYRCIGAIFRNRPVECSVNPEAGREAVAAAGPTGFRHVVVAGGGPAGLECGRRLAERGHRVELWEASDRLGGALAVAEAVDPDLEGLLAWLIAGAEDAGVEIHLRRPLTAAVQTDVVVWAAGADWGPGLAEVERWLDEGQEPSALAVHGSSKAAVSVAVRARQARAAVTLVPDDPVLAPELGLPGRFRLVADARRSGVAIADTAPPDVSSVHMTSRTARPAPDLGRGIEVHVIGDATGESGLAAAFRSAADLAASL
jgi:2,4-dienoyl-CoA reductase (NADPH2)